MLLCCFLNRYDNNIILLLYYLWKALLDFNALSQLKLSIRRLHCKLEYFDKITQYLLLLFYFIHCIKNNLWYTYFV